MNNGRSGRYFEYRVRDDLRADGYLAFCSSGSHGVADVIAIKPGEVLLVQAKTNGRVDPDEWNTLLSAAVRHGCTAIVAHRPQRGRITYMRITGTKTGIKGARPPWEPWQSDQVGEVADA